MEQPPLARPFHLPSYESGSVRALALVEPVRLLIAKGAVELVVPAVFPYPGFSSCLFVVQKPGMGTWRPIIVLSGLTVYGGTQMLIWDPPVRPLVGGPWGLVGVCGPPGRVLPDSVVTGFSEVPPVRLARPGVPVPSPVLRTVSGSPGFSPGVSG